MNRREFIKKAGLLGLGAVALPFLPKLAEEKSPILVYEDGHISLLEPNMPWSGFAITQLSEGADPILTTALRKSMLAMKRRMAADL